MARKNVIRALAGTACVLLVAGAAGPGAAAVTMEDSGDVQATVRKTVLQTATASGEILTSRMYTQVSAVGNGTKTVLVPVGTTSNRNLNEFGAFPMEGESIQFDLTVDGGAEERTLTDADINPMEVTVKVLLDGVEIQPEDVVGASGVLDVQYTVRNTTARNEQITFTDVEGTESTETIEVAEPYGGSLDITLPKGFNEITAPGATIAGDGTNQTSLGFSLVLFPPLGSPVATVGYQARISNGEMPAAVFSFLPIVPLDNSTVAGTLEAYKGGMSTGASIFDAGVQIGDNLLKLQEGAGQLVSGLGQLSAGAEQLSDGLVNTAAPGAAALADGANQVSDGLDELNGNVPALEDGVSDLNAGAKQLNGGAQQVAEGNADLADGANELQKNVPALVDGVNLLDAGAKQVADGLLTLDSNLKNLPATVKATADYKRLVGAIGLIQGQIGSPSDTGTDTALGALNTIGALMGLADTQTTTGAVGLGAAAAQLTCASNPTVGACPAVLAGLDALTRQAPLDKPETAGSIQQIKTTGAIAGGLSKKLYNEDTSGCAMNPPVDCGAYQALEGIKQGIGTLVDSIAKGIYDSPDFKKLVAGGQSVSTGMASLAAKTPALAGGVDQLAAGADQLADGSAQVADGTEALAEGTKTLNSKVPALASGVAQLDDGAAQVADGANQLADGLGDAADGSGQLVDGLQQAEPGGAQIEAGAGQLKEEGADVLADTGKDAQLGFARDVALIEAAQQMGLEGSNLPFGPAQGTDVTTSAAVQLQLAGIAADTENNALKLGLGALLIAGAGGAAFAAARKVAA